jgi:predicted site-specific integrase-resolvase
MRVNKMVQTAVLEPKVTSTVLSSNEVAWLLGTDVMTLENWGNAGIIKPCRNSFPGDKHFRREDIAALLAKIGA